MTSPLSYDRLRELEKLFVAALRWAEWCAGEGICSISEDIADPEDFLMAYTNATGDEGWETMAERLPADLLTRIADLEGENARVSLALEEILNASSVGKAGQTVSFRSKYANYPARLYHAGRAAFRALSGTDTGEKVGG